MKDKNLYYDLAKFETEMLASRSNMLLVFQSMLFAAVAGLAVAGNNILFPPFLIIILGFSTSIVWLILNWATYLVAEEALNRLKNDPELESIFQSIRDNYPSYKNISTGWIMYVMFPSLTGATWFFIFLHYISNNF